MPHGHINRALLTWVTSSGAEERLKLCYRIAVQLPAGQEIKHTDLCFFFLDKSRQTLGNTFV